jgi:hypothetical protein
VAGDAGGACQHFTPYSRFSLTPPALKDSQDIHRTFYICSQAGTIIIAWQEGERKEEMAMITKVFAVNGEVRQACVFCILAASDAAVNLPNMSL